MAKKKKLRKQATYRKRFFRKSNPLLRESNKIIKRLFGNNEEKLGQFEMIEQGPEYKKLYPDELKRKDISRLVRAMLTES
jgi:hypothetical protein